MVVLRPGDWLWLSAASDSSFKVPIGCKVKTANKRQIILVDDEGNTQELDTARAGSRIRQMHPSSIQGVKDMILLGDLHEAGILRNLHIRYKEGEIYTYTGSILVAVNPYKVIPGLYEQPVIEKYSNKRIGEEDPHIFAIADNAYTGMKSNNQDQCVVVSGESGSGKTESTKLMLQFLASASGQHSSIEQQILESNPILEAFGNAKTLRNDNSSRFGKYIDIVFNKTGQIECARIEEYLLEKSRLIWQQRGERNFHIFYMLFAGMSNEEKANYGLRGTPLDYPILKTGHGLSLQSWNDRAEFGKVAAAMKVLNFSESEMKETFKLLAALLHYSKIEVRETTVNNLDACTVLPNKDLEHAVILLGVNVDDVRRQMTQRSIKLKGETVTTPMNLTNSKDVKDALIKGLYGRLFTWIVGKINSSVSRGKDGQKKRKGDPSLGKSIGLLDIFGFEKFDKNSFEQLCINYANENLQQFFVHHVFKLEQEEYAKEGIKWNAIDFTDNQNILDLIGQQPLNIFALIDEEAFYPSGTDDSMLNKLKQIHSSNELFQVNRAGDSVFFITHFAGQVTYTIDGFLEKNRDTFHADSVNLIKMSSNKFLVYLLNKDIKTLSQQKQGGRKKSLAYQFKKSLDDLMSSLHKCHPFFVRCVKPNENKLPLVYDRELVCRQLTYSGMMETITIRKAGYPIRYDFEYFAQRFDVCVPGLKLQDNLAYSAKCRLILTHVLPGMDWKLGRFKVFLKDGHEVNMEDSREASLLKYVIRIQRAVRAWYQRRTFIRLKNSILMIQTRFRGINARIAYTDKRNGYARLQALWKSRKLQFRYNFGRRRIIGLQAMCRGYLARTEKTRAYESILVIQAYIRGLVARRNHKQRIWLKDLEKLSPSDRKKRLAVLERQEKANIEAILLANQRLKQQDDQNKNDQQLIDEAFIDITGEDDVDFGADDHFSTVGDDAAFEEDLSDYKFSKFAATYFTASVMHSHLRRQIKEPLLHHDDEADRSAALAVWVTILRFMGDMSEPRSPPVDVPDRNEPIMYQIHKTWGRAAKQKQKLINQTIKKKSKIHSNTDRFKSFTDHLTTSLEKIHFIIGTGILRPELRDEIYCQICKQLTRNPSRISAARGWVLLSLSLGCFGPTEQLDKYLRCFIRESSQSRYQYYEEKLKRTIQNGCRQQPPSWIELQHAKHKKPMSLGITLMDGTVSNVKCDSATNSQEVALYIAEKADINDNFGFSLFVSLFDKVSSLGSGTEHVMDAISQCEQYAKEQGVRESNAPWKMFYRKEVFTPWYNPALDRISTGLIHAQLRRGIFHGEYRCDKQQLIKFISQDAYYNYGANCTKVDVGVSARALVPEDKFKTDNWTNLAHKEVLKIPKGTEQAKTLDQMVKSARQLWTLEFSRFYEMQTVSRDSQYLTRNSKTVIMAINWAGVFLVDSSENLLLSLKFMEIRSIDLLENSRNHPIGITLQTVQGKNLQFSCSCCTDVYELVSSFLEGLKARSRYAVAVRDVLDVETGFLKMEKGDLIKMDHIAGDGLLTNSWDGATCMRTKSMGSIQSQDVWVLATIVEPEPDMTKMFKMNKVELESLNKKLIESFEDSKHSKSYFTLEEYASDFFNVKKEEVSKSGVISNVSKTRKSTPLWAKESEPIKRALLQRTPDQLNSEAVLMHLAIMKFSTDYPTRKPDYMTEITDQVFTPAINRIELRDELYCQLMKQLTRNMNRISEAKTWQLMWLACGLFPPSPQLQPQLNKFLSSRDDNQMALECASRVYKANRGGPRRFCPHPAELEAIEHNTTTILHKVFLGPDQVEDIIEVESSSKAKDICLQLGKKLGMKSIEGFSLFVRIMDKVVSIKENQFFFDYIRQLSDLLRRSQSGHVDYQVFFMRKLWVNFVPGRDPVADSIFNYAQEVPKYLRGYYDIPPTIVGKLGALIFLASYGESKDFVKKISKENLEKLMPQGLKLKPDAVKKEIMANLNELSETTSDEAKLAFLVELHKIETFGSAFFEVLQTTDSALPQRILVAIMKRGIIIIDPATKKILLEHGYAKISNWSCGETYFTLQVGSVIRASKLICETTLGYKMENLVSSYIDHIHQNIQKTQSKGNF